MFTKSKFACCKLSTDDSRKTIVPIAEKSSPSCHAKHFCSPPSLGSLYLTEIAVSNMYCLIHLQTFCVGLLPLVYPLRSIGRIALEVYLVASVHIPSFLDSRCVES